MASHDSGRPPKRPRVHIDPAADLAGRCAILERKLDDACRHMVTLARDNERLRVLLARYYQKDESLISFSQLSQNSMSSQPEPDGEVIISQLSQLSEPGEEAQLSSVYDWMEGNRSSVLSLTPEDAKAPERVPTGVGVIITDASHPNAILVGRRKGSHGAGTLSLPGGHLEVQERWAACAAREVKEECGLDLSEEQLALKWVDNSAMRDEAKHYTTVFLRAAWREGNGAVRNMEPQKCEGWDYVPVEELRTLCREDPARVFIPLRNALLGGMDPLSPALGFSDGA